MLALVAAVLAAASPPPVVRTAVFARGEARTQFTFRMHAPAFSAVRLVVPHAAVVSLLASDRAQRMGIAASSDPARGACSQRGRYDVCDTYEEACPAPQGRWVARLTRHGRTDAPMRVRVRFTFTNRAG